MDGEAEKERKKKYEKYNTFTVVCRERNYKSNKTTSKCVCVCVCECRDTKIGDGIASIRADAYVIVQFFTSSLNSRLACLLEKDKQVEKLVPRSLMLHFSVSGKKCSFFFFFPSIDVRRLADVFRISASYLSIVYVPSIYLSACMAL